MSGCLEEIVLAEGMQLVELHRVDAQAHVDGRLQQKRFLPFVGNHLHTDALHLAENAAFKLLDEDLCVGLHLALRAELPVVALGCEKGVGEVIVAVVDEKALEGCGRHLLGIDGHESQEGREAVAPLALLHGRFVGHGTCRRVVILIIVEYAHLSLFLMVHGFHARHGISVHLGYVVVVAHHDHHLIDGGGNLETVLVFHEHDVLALEAGHDAASRLTEKSYFITYFHCFSFF